MKLVIELSDECINDINESIYPNDLLVGEAIYAIENGIPLEDIKKEIMDYFEWGDVSSTDQKAIIEIINKHI